MLPDPEKRLITTLFLGTALSISSVKIVAMVVREVGFLRRAVGQVIVAAAIIDDTIGWIIMSVTFGLALHGGIDVPALVQSLIVALFMPVFFGLAGLTTNLAVLAQTDLLLLTFGLIAIASLGKFGGAFLGGRLGGMTWAESLALGCGMNARGSTEVIVATIGLSMGVLNQDLFTTIVTMAVVTTMSMPPMLRWALGRLPMRPEEAARLEREEFDARGFVSNIERLLVAVDASPSGQFASRLVGLLAGARGIPATVIHFDYETAGSLREGVRQAERTKAVVKESAEAGGEAGPAEPRADPVEITTRVEKPSDDAIAAEARKGYGLLFIGREPASEGDTFHEQITRSAAEFAGPLAIVIARGIDRRETVGTRLNILVP